MQQPFPFFCEYLIFRTFTPPLGTRAQKDAHTPLSFPFSAAVKLTLPSFYPLAPPCVEGGKRAKVFMTTGKNEGDAPLFFCGWLGMEEGVLAGFEERNVGIQRKFANV